MGVSPGEYFGRVVEEVDQDLLDEDVVHGDHRESVGKPGEDLPVLVIFPDPA